MNENAIPIFYEGQDDLIDILATSIASVCYNTKSFINFYILDCGINDNNKKLLKLMKEEFDNFSIEFISVDLSVFKGLRGWGPHKDNLDVYARLLIPDLKPELKKVIYLDSDTICMNDIQSLYDVDLEEYAYAATPELGCDKVIFDNCVNNLGIDKNHIYPSAGMLVLNLEKIKNSKKLVQICRDYNDKLMVYNEEIFSIAFGCNGYKKLDLRYNMADRINRIKDVNAPEITDEYIEEEWKHVVIQHLTPTKPHKYIYSETGKIARNIWNFWFYAKMTPFYAGMMARYNWVSIENIVFNQLNSINFGERFVNKRYIKLFGIIPIVTIKRNNNKIKYKLFGFLPILTEKRK